MNTKNFKTLPLSKQNIDNLTSLGFHQMTEIQALALPFVLNKKDIIAKAKTGSGKTVAFGLGVINNLQSGTFRIQALILCPTRELSSQISGVLRQLVRYIHNIKILSLTGGVPYKPQVHSLSHQAHIIVGTPGRVLKHLQENNFQTDHINTLVLDEADRMVDMGFYEDIESIINFLPKKRQTMLFSATFSEVLQKQSECFLEDPILLETEQTHSQTTIDQRFFQINEEEKKDILVHLFSKEISSAIIFCNTKIECDALADHLKETYDFEALVLHSDYEQTYRDETLLLFENKSYPLLIATDVASRGLDIDNVDLVINYDMPDSFENYLHRIGRTARAGNKGVSVSFINDMEYFYELEEFLERKFHVENTDKIKINSPYIPPYEYSTLYIKGGKKEKLRAGDILGALIQGLGLHKDDIGKISILARSSYVAVKNEVFEKAYQGLQNTKIKNRYFSIDKC